VPVGPPTVVVLHAHPDDEAIFTGGTVRLLADAGVRVVLVFATSGERGATTPGTAPGRLAARRRAETEVAAAVLGATRVAFLGYADSGLVPDPDDAGAFALADGDEAAGRLADVLAEEGAAALVTDDAGGIYGHPDHVRAHEVGRRAAAIAGTATRYEVTVDREHLHFVETHLVEQAGASLLQGDLGTAGSAIGRATVEIDLVVDVRPVLAAKRAAMAAHASQIPEESSALLLAGPAFAGVYGWEWYVRHGPPGPLDTLA
jgi:LmbE family N-acetylglucosaminyl deacetylase